GESAMVRAAKFTSEPTGASRGSRSLATARLRVLQAFARPSFRWTHSRPAPRRMRQLLLPYTDAHVSTFPPGGHDCSRAIHGQFVRRSAFGAKPSAYARSSSGSAGDMAQ